MSVFNTTRVMGVSVKKNKLYYTPIERVNNFLLGSAHMDFDEESGDYVPSTLGLSFNDKLSRLLMTDYYIEDNQVGRPDLVAFDYYGDTDYWRWISLVNNLITWEEYVANLKIKLPLKSSLDSFLVDHINYRASLKRANKR